MFQTGSNKWVPHTAWPPKNAVTKKLYFHAGGKLSFEEPTDDEKAFESLEHARSLVLHLGAD